MSAAPLPVNRLSRSHPLAACNNPHPKGYPMILSARSRALLAAAAVSLYLFGVQRGQTSGREKCVCSWGFWLVIIALVLRDMCLSGQLAAAYCRMIAAGLPLHS